MDYNRKARTLPSIVAMIFPALATSFLIYDLNLRFSLLELAIGILLKFVPICLIYTAIGYFATELFRSTGKFIFQFLFFNEDETYMPSTEMLLWKSKDLSEQEKKRFYAKVFEQFKIKLLTPKQEKTRENEARLVIAEAIRKIRNLTRDDSILLQYNIEYGFYRNFLGASVYSILFLLICVAISYFNFIGCSCKPFLVLLAINIVLNLPIFFFLKHSARAYARQLIGLYLSKY